MRIDKMAAWIGRPAAGAERLQLCWEGPAATESLTDWTFDEMQTMQAAGDDIAETVQAAAQEHCDAQDGRRCKYVLRWIGSSNRVLRSTAHHVRPTPQEDEDPLGAAIAELPDVPQGQGASGAQGPFYEVMVKELARALLDKDRQLNEAYKTSLHANRDTIQMLMAQSEASFRLVAELRAQVAELQEQAPEVLTDAQRQESLKRAQAWDKLLSMLPEATDLLMHAVTSKLLASADAGESQTAPNGHAGAA